MTRAAYWAARYQAEKAARPQPPPRGVYVESELVDGLRVFRVEVEDGGGEREVRVKDLDRSDAFLFAMTLAGWR